MNSEALRIRETFNYDPDTGIVTRLRAVGRWKAGRQVGYKSRKGYLRARFEDKQLMCTHIAFLFMVGRRPVGQIDHINGNREDNRWCNLREVTGSVNGQNRRRPDKDNKSGYLGVSPYRHRWMAFIWVNSKNLYLGTFATPEEAHEEYLKAKRALHAGCTI